MQSYISNLHVGFRILLILIIVSIFFVGCCRNNSNIPSGPLPTWEEKYCILLDTPAENYVFEENASPPTFKWSVQQGEPITFTIEIDYLGGKPYLSKTVTGLISYTLSAEDWETIKQNAPVENGMQNIYWRIRIDYTIYSDEGPYYSQWGYFGIKAN